MALFSTIAWSLWQWRNHLKEHQLAWTLHEVGDRARAMVLEFMDANEQVVKPQVRNILVRWSPPQENVYKANFDVALFDNMGYAGLGVVIRDCNGHIIAALSKKIKLPYSVETAEALAAHRAVTFAKELSIFKVVVEGNCLRVVQALKALDRCKTLYGNVIDDTHRQGVTLQHCQFQHVR